MSKSSETIENFITVDEKILAGLSFKPTDFLEMSVYDEEGLCLKRGGKVYLLSFEFMKLPVSNPKDHSAQVLAGAIRASYILGWFPGNVGGKSKDLTWSNLIGRPTTPAMLPFEANARQIATTLKGLGDAIAGYNGALVHKDAILDILGALKDDVPKFNEFGLRQTRYVVNQVINFVRESKEFYLPSTLSKMFPPEGDSPPSRAIIKERIAKNRYFASWKKTSGPVDVTPMDPEEAFYAEKEKFSQDQLAACLIAFGTLGTDIVVPVVKGFCSNYDGVDSIPKIKKSIEKLFSLLVSYDLAIEKLKKVEARLKESEATREKLSDRVSSLEDALAQAKIEKKLGQGSDKPKSWWWKFKKSFSSKISSFFAFFTQD